MFEDVFYLFVLVLVYLIFVAVTMKRYRCFLTKNIPTGKFDELARLLGDAFANDIRMRELLGESREEYERKLRERMAARKRGL